MSNTVSEEGVKNVDLARRIYERGNDSLKSNGDKQSRALLLEAWRDFENEFGDADSQAKISAKMPRRVKQRRRVVAEDGVIVEIFNLCLVVHYYYYLFCTVTIFLIF